MRGVKSGGGQGGQLRKDCRYELAVVGCGKGHAGCSRGERTCNNFTSPPLNHVVLFSLLRS